VCMANSSMCVLRAMSSLQESLQRAGGRGRKLQCPDFLSLGLARKLEGGQTSHSRCLYNNKKSSVGSDEVRLGGMRQS